MPVSELGKDSNGKPGDFTKVNKGLNELANMLILSWFQSKKLLG